MHDRSRALLWKARIPWPIPRLRPSKNPRPNERNRSVQSALQTKNSLFTLHSSPFLLFSSKAMNLVIVCLHHIVIAEKADDWGGGRAGDDREDLKP